MIGGMRFTPSREAASFSVASPASTCAESRLALTAASRSICFCSSAGSILRIAIGSSSSRT